MTPEVDCSRRLSTQAPKALDQHYLRGSLCGYLDDDKALDCGDPALIYDQVIGYGASLVQDPTVLSSCSSTSAKRDCTKIGSRLDSHNIHLRWLHFSIFSG